MFDIEKFIEEFEKADVYTTIKGLCLKLSSAENDIDRTAIMNHLFDMVDVAEMEYKAMTHDCAGWKVRSYDEYKTNRKLRKKLEAIQKAAST